VASRAGGRRFPESRAVGDFRRAGRAGGRDGARAGRSSGPSPELGGRAGRSSPELVGRAASAISGDRQRRRAVEVKTNIEHKEKSGSRLFPSSAPRSVAPS
jgi:hypothetical protein